MLLLNGGEEEKGVICYNVIVGRGKSGGGEMGNGWGDGKGKGEERWKSWAYGAPCHLTSTKPICINPALGVSVLD